MRKAEVLTKVVLEYKLKNPDVVITPSTKNLVTIFY